MSLARSLAAGLLLGLLFFAWFAHTSDKLPRDAGPDFAAHVDAASFIFHHDRLVRIPEDEHRIRYTVYGSTRTLRPPLAYLAGAGMAKLIGPDPDRVQLDAEQLAASMDYQQLFDQSAQTAYRKGSALLMALAVVFSFLALLSYFRNGLLALTGATLIGLMPQVTFLASYSNDDSAAICAASLAILALVLLQRHGGSLARIGLLGFATGLLVISKPTAWLLIPAIALYLLIAWPIPRNRLLPWMAAGLAAFVIGGGWWLAWNTAHYGIGDPTARNIAAELGKRHQSLPDKALRGYADRGVSTSELLLRNHDHFWHKTLKTTIGKLDHIRLNVGPAQYGLYLLVFALGLAGLVRRLAGIAGALPGRGPPDAPGDARFELLLGFMVVFQFGMFVWRNMTTEVQLQGRYLLPALLPLVILAFSFLEVLGGRLAAAFRRRNADGLVLAPVTLGRLSLLALLLTVLLVHWQALDRYVLPYYFPPAYQIGMTPLQNAAIQPGGVETSADVQRLSATESGLRLVASGSDPYLILDPPSCEVAGNLLLHFVIESEHPSRFQVFIDRGQGFVESDSWRKDYAAGRSTLIAVLDARGCQRIRIDPANDPGAYYLEMSFSQMIIRPPQD
ncbi:MAG: DUF2142 domain-containing protein [Gammaproteobacteria bacterium]|nr:DUF2142 domain-containing protein [Gammaproteobacteria bacterium]